MKSYIIYSMPRSGTRLLKSLLMQQNCGTPSENLNPIEIEKFEVMPRQKRLPYFYELGTQGGIFGITIHTYHLMNQKGIDFLKELSGTQQEDPFELLRRLFPCAKHLYLYRRNKLKQAISWLKAERTGAFSKNKDSMVGEYSSGDISENIKRISRFDAIWLGFFEKYDIHPFTLTYEELCRNKKRMISNILDFLEVDRDNIHINPDMLPARLYNTTSEEWYQRYLKEI